MIICHENSRRDKKKGGRNINKMAERWISTVSIYFFVNGIFYSQTKEKKMHNMLILLNKVPTMPPTPPPPGAQ